MRRVLRFRDEQQAKMVIAGPPGRKFTEYVEIDIPIRVKRVTNEEFEAYSSEIQGAWKPRKACREFLRLGKPMGITKGAKRFLKAGLS